VCRRHVSWWGLRLPECALSAIAKDDRRYSISDMPNRPSALSFLLAGSSLPDQHRRVATALPRTAYRIALFPGQRRSAVSEPSPGTPLALPRQFYSGHSPPLRLFTAKAATSTSPTRRGTGLPNPEAAVVPALASVFNPEVTSLGRVSARSARVCAAFRQAILSRPRWSDFPLRNQKLGVPFPHGCSQFSTVSSGSHWQALPYVFGWAFHG